MAFNKHEFLFKNFFLFFWWGVVGRGGPHGILVPQPDRTLALSSESVEF